jgi:hypothetical protein
MSDLSPQGAPKRTSASAKIGTTQSTSAIKAASVGGLFHDSLDNGPRGAWSSPPVR